MLDKMKQIGKLAKLRGEAKQIQKSLSREEIKIEKGKFSVIVDANQEVKQIKIDGEDFDFLTNVLNEALAKSKKVAAKKMQSLAGDLFNI